ncbi:MAG: PHA/PHB synthase family protein [Panacagrimonas sp.]
MAEARATTPTKRRAAAKPAPARSAPKKASRKPGIPSPADVAAEAIPADTTYVMASAEGPEGMTLRDSLSTLRTMIDGSKASSEAASLARELVKIILGKSKVTVHPKDPRFKDPAWTENPVFKRLAQGYEAFCHAVEGSLAEGGDWKKRERAGFIATLLTSSLAPSNYLLTNPTALRTARETHGRSLVRGVKNFVNDLRNNGGMPSQVDRSQFKVGEQLGVTPGAVIFRNEVLEIIQYKPQTPNMYARPVLLMTPQINKFYFLDLAPERSFIEYGVRQGIQMFIVSWRNPTRKQAHWNLDTYVKALLDATDAVRDIGGTGDLNTFGFCAGGITMSALLGHLAATGDNRVHCASYAVTLLDFDIPALIGILNSPGLLKKAVAHSKKLGVLPGQDLGKIFAWFRPNDLVWNYWVNNYLLGKKPPTFDILAWNADSTNLPAGLHADFLGIFSKNPLVRPGAFKALGSPVDLRKVKIDTFVTGAVTDHLTPWKGCYRTTQMLGGNSTFVLSNAGHIASLVNPPGGKSSYWTGPKPGPDENDWYKNAVENKGTWWEFWAQWVSERSGKEIAAPTTLGSKRFPPLDDAPGTYVFS